MAFDVYQPNHYCYHCRFRRLIYDNYDEVIEEECIYEYEVDSAECNKKYEDNGEF